MSFKFLSVLFAVSLIFICGPAQAEETVQDTNAGISEFAGKTYVCEKCGISQDEPGTCPSCGNDLVEKEIKDNVTTELPEDQVTAEEPTPNLSK